MNGVLQDLRFALRGFRRNRVFPLAVILITAVGIGTAAAVFSIVDRLLFRSLPYPKADRIASVGIAFNLFDGIFYTANGYFHLKEVDTGFASLTSWRGVAGCDLTEETPLRLGCAEVAYTFLDTLGISPLIGRGFAQEEDRPHAAKVAIISYGFWRSRFAGRPDVLRKKISIDGVPTEIVGVLPRGFELPTLVHADLLVPQSLGVTHYIPGQSSGPVRIFGRLKDGVSIERARQMTAPYILDEIHELLPQRRWKEARADIRSLRDFQIQDVRTASWVLFASTGVILLIVCANVANLILARLLNRQKEFTVRAALGATWGRLFRQRLTESLLLSGIGATLGCALASALMQIFKNLAPTEIPRMDQIALDVRVLVFAAGMAVLCGVLFGLAPAGGARSSFRNMLSAGQVGLSLVLLSSAGLLLRSLWNLQRVATGIGTQQVLTADITVGPHHYPSPAARQQFFDDLANHLRAMPGVESVAISDSVPPSGLIRTNLLDMIRVVGKPPFEKAPGRIVAHRVVSLDYFAALRIPLLQGRVFEDADLSSRENPLVVSASLARYLFRGENAVGRQIDYGPAGGIATIVGVVGDVKNNDLGVPADPEFYKPRKRNTNWNSDDGGGIVARAFHVYDGEWYVIVRSLARPEVVANWIRTQVAAIDPSVPAVITPMRQRVAQMSERPRFSAVLLGFFALVGVLLAAGGLYGLVAFLVARRTREIGIRMALGARPSQIASLVMSQAFRWTLVGVVAGIAGSIAAGRVLRSLLFQVPVGDPLHIGAVVILLTAVTLAATLVPSLRAARTDPMSALRQD